MAEYNGAARSNSRTVTLGETTFYLRKMDPFQSLAILGDLQADILPPLGYLIGKRESVPALPGEAPKEVSSADFPSAMRELSGHLRGPQITAWADRLLDPDYISFTLNGRDAKLTREMRGLAFQDVGDILELMAEVLTLNYADFFVRWADRIGLAPDLQSMLKSSVASVQSSSANS